jgi:trans-aconitate methyltransferase
VQQIRHAAPAEHQWMRQVMNREAEVFFRSLPMSTLDAAEVSGWLRASLPWKTYTSLQYPEFDLCTSTPEEAYDVVICEQVLEHVPDLTAAVTNLMAMCRPGAWLYVSTPFLVKLHGHPDDYWRLTPSGMRVVLEKAGFRVESVQTWGNRACVQRNLRRWAHQLPWRSLRNDDDVPVVVWAIARRDPLPT